MPFLYRLAAGGGAVERYEVSDKPVVVGRTRECQLSVPEDELLSARHFLVERRAGVVMIQDLRSKNGTWVNGKRIEECELKLEDRIFAGKTNFRLESGLNTMVQSLVEE